MWPIALLDRGAGQARGRPVFRNPGARTPAFKGFVREKNSLCVYGQLRRSRAIGRAFKATSRLTGTLNVRVVAESRRSFLAPFAQRVDFLQVGLVARHLLAVADSARDYDVGMIEKSAYFDTIECTKHP